MGCRLEEKKQNKLFLHTVVRKIAKRLRHAKETPSGSHENNGDADAMGLVTRRKSDGITQQRVCQKKTLFFTSRNPLKHAELGPSMRSTNSAVSLNGADSTVASNEAQHRRSQTDSTPVGGKQARTIVEKHEPSGGGGGKPKNRMVSIILRCSATLS